MAAMEEEVEDEDDKDEDGWDEVMHGARATRLQVIQLHASERCGVPVDMCGTM